MTVEKEPNRKYKINPYQCPFCDSLELFVFAPENSNNMIIKEVHCLSCGKEYNEVYSVAYIQTLDPIEGEFNYAHYIK